MCSWGTSKTDREIVQVYLIEEEECIGNLKDLGHRKQLLSSFFHVKKCGSHKESLNETTQFDISERIISSSHCS